MLSLFKRFLKKILYLSVFPIKSEPKIFHAFGQKIMNHQAGLFFTQVKIKYNKFSLICL